MMSCAKPSVLLAAAFFSGPALTHRRRNSHIQNPSASLVHIVRDPLSMNANAAAESRGTRMEFQLLRSFFPSPHSHIYSEIYSF